MRIEGGISLNDREVGRANINEPGLLSSQSGRKFQSIC